MKPRVITLTPVAAAFAMAVGAAPLAVQATPVATAPATADTAAAEPLQPSAAMVARLHALSGPTDKPKEPWGEVWVEYDPFIEVQK